VKIFRYFVVVTSALAVSFASSAQAASLTSIQGGVRINSGSGFHEVGRDAQVTPGTSVMVAPGGSADILYSDGCRIPVRPGAVQVVAPVSPCALGQAGPGQQTQNTFYDVLLAAGVIGGSVTAGVLASEHNNNNPVIIRPASP
jgi:hypothetical protein